MTNIFFNDNITLRGWVNYKSPLDPNVEYAITPSAEYNAILAELADLREQVRWRKTKEEPPEEGTFVQCSRLGLKYVQVLKYSRGGFVSHDNVRNEKIWIDYPLWKPLSNPPEEA